MSWTKEQYKAMQIRAQQLGFVLITPYRKNLKNIRVGVIGKAYTPVHTDNEVNHD